MFFTILDLKLQKNSRKVVLLRILLVIDNTGLIRAIYHSLLVRKVVLFAWQEFPTRPREFPNPIRKSVFFV